MVETIPLAYLVNVSIAILIPSLNAQAFYDNTPIDYAVFKLFFINSRDLFCLHLGVNVIHRLDILAVLNSSQIVYGDFYNQGRKNNYADKVGDHHKTVEGVGDIPRERRGEYSTEKTVQTWIMRKIKVVFAPKRYSHALDP